MFHTTPSGSAPLIHVSKTTSLKRCGLMNWGDPIVFYLSSKTVSEWWMLGARLATHAFKSHQEISNMHITKPFGDGLSVELEGAKITKITKSGVVIWPQERHTAPM